MRVKILAIGDVVGESGLRFLEKRLKTIREKWGIHFCIVNGENANVVGITPEQAERIFRAGADVITLGNHTWTRWELQPFLDANSRILRPANFAPQCPGSGDATYQTPFGPIRVINLLGRFTLDANTDNPFVAVESLLAENQTRMVMVDFHAEATSEKLAMGYMLDGRVSAVWGTHTHVQTSDSAILPGGTGYITDLGMTGPAHGVLGISPNQSIRKFLGDPPRRYEQAKGDAKMECCLFEIESESGECVGINAFRIDNNSFTAERGIFS